MICREATAHTHAMEYTLQASTLVPASPYEVLDLITDIERLPDWNLEIPRVVDVPTVLEVGAEWVVTIHAMKTHWNSRSRVVEVDRDRGRFAYRSQSDDGNPSHADWRWQLVPAAEGQGTQYRPAPKVSLESRATGPQQPSAAPPRQSSTTGAPLPALRAAAP